MLSKKTLGSATKTIRVTMAIAWKTILLLEKSKYAEAAAAITAIVVPGLVGTMLF
jgi:hypothetical protein